ncbi:MAG: ChaN family lipoprotein [Porticoccus sp.]
MRSIIVGVTLVFLLIGCTAVNSPVISLEPAHPLVGRIFRADAYQEITSPELIEALASADVIYLGERHDNQQHRHEQLRLVMALLERGLRPQLGMEVFSVETTPLLMRYSQGAGTNYAVKGSPDDILRQQLGWGADYDGPWQRYGSLIQLARKEQLPLFGIDLSKPLRRRITQLGVNELTPLEKNLLYPSVSPDENYRVYMYRVLKRAHCGWGSPEYLGRLYDNWLARNDAMATSITTMAERPSEGPVVVIVGAGHTEFNRGVYERVKIRSPHLNQVNLILQGVQQGKSEPPYYFQAEDVFEQESDREHEIMLFTDGPQGKSDEDLCKEFLRKNHAPKKNSKLIPL